MTKKMPSGTNFFKALIKEEPDETHVSVDKEGSSEQTNDDNVTGKVSDENAQIENVVKIMEQAALDNDVVEKLAQSSPEAASTRNEDAKAVVEKTGGKKASNSKLVKPAEDKIEVYDTPTESETKSKSRKPPLIKKSIYFTKEQIYQIRVHAAQNDCDSSLVVRKAIDAYLNNDGK